MIRNLMTFSGYCTALQQDFITHEFFTPFHHPVSQFCLIQCMCIHLPSWNGEDFSPHSFPAQWNQLLKHWIPEEACRGRCLRGEILLQRKLRHQYCVYLVILKRLYQVLHLGGRFRCNKFGPEASQVEPRHQCWPQGFFWVGCGLFPCPL